MPSSGEPAAVALSDHVIVAGYGVAARHLVRVLRGSAIPFVITTLSPGGAREAEAEQLLVLRGDAGRQLTLIRAGIERARVVVIADDDPPTTYRVSAVARTLAPDARILTRTRYMSEIASLKEAGSDHVISEELESIVGLFSEVLRTYQVEAANIETHEETIRGGGYEALLGAARGGKRPASRRDRAPPRHQDACHPDDHVNGLQPPRRRASGDARLQGLRGMPPHWQQLGAPPDLHDLRACGLLRQLTASPRHGALPRLRPSDHAIG